MSFASGWKRLSARERTLVLLAAAVLCAFLLWRVGLAPALRTLATAPSALHQLDLQLATMQEQAGEAQRLRQQGMPARAPDPLRVLDAATQQHLGAGAAVTANGERATVNLKAATPEGLMAWLALVRESAGAVTEQASLRRGAHGWEGSIVLRLPATP